MKRIILAASVAVLPLVGYSFSPPALADDTATSPTPESSAQSAAPTSPSGEGVGTLPAEPAAVPPPSEAVIPAQRANEVRAENLIGTTVFSPEGEKVGTVKDILFDTSGKATGVVLSIGGIMGLGAKSVGLTWDEVDVQPEPRLLQVKYTQDQLEAAPTFKTQEAQQAEAEAVKVQSEMPAQPPLSAEPSSTPPSTE